MVSSGIRDASLAGFGTSSERRLIAGYLGPACLAWAIWVLRTASQRGIKRLYFVSRDGFLAWRCAAALQPSFGIDCRYLMISRQALLPAVTTGVSREDLPWLITKWDRPRLSLLAGRLGLKFEECGTELRRLATLRDPDATLGQ